MKVCEGMFYVTNCHFDLNVIFYFLEEKVAYVCAESRALATQNIMHFTLQPQYGCYMRDVGC